MAEDDVIVTTEVTVPDPTPEVTPEPENNTTAVVVSTPDSGGDVTPAVIEHEGRLAHIEETLEQIAQRLMSTEVTAEVAAETANAALDEAMTPEPEPEPEPDRTPGKKHLLHRSWGELLGRSS
jgi:hypothetical protein